MTREEKEETYMALFNGGAHKDSLRRIGLNLKLGEEIDHLQYFLHGGRIAIALFDNDNVLLKSSSFDYKSPQITTKVTSSPEANQSVAKEVDFSLLVKNSKTSALISSSKMNLPEIVADVLLFFTSRLKSTSFVTDWFASGEDVTLVVI